MPELRSAAARQAWETRRSARYRASKSEKAGKAALASWCHANDWRVVFFEGPTGAPRTGIVDAVIVRIRPGDADALDLRLVQIKSGVGGLTPREIARLKDAVAKLSKDWLLAAFDGETLHLLPEVPHRGSLGGGAYRSAAGAGQRRAAPEHPSR